MYKINNGTKRDLQEWINRYAEEGYRFKHMIEYGTGMAVIIEKPEVVESTKSSVEIKVVEPAKPAVEKKVN